MSEVTVKLFKDLCSVDGALLLRGDGSVIDAGLILNLPPDASPEEGARTAAAKAASKYGLAVKVSADGPVTVYKEGQKLAFLT